MKRLLSRQYLLLFTLVAAGFAASWFYHRHSGCYRTVGAVGRAGSLVLSFEDLGLSDEQTEKLLAIDEAHEKKYRVGRETLARARIALSEMLAESAWNEAQIKTQCRVISDLQHAEQVRLIDLLKRLRVVMTDEQRERFFTSICCQLCNEFQVECGTGSCVCGKCDVREGE